MVDAREADGVVFVRAELEGRDPGGGERGDGVQAPVLADGAVEGDVDMAVRSTQPIFCSSSSGEWMDCGTSYGMSTQVVMPPAAAERVAPSIPGKPMLLPVCMWPSTRPGMMSWPVWSAMSVAGGGSPWPMAAMISPRVATYPRCRMPDGVTMSPRKTRSKGEGTGLGGLSNACRRCDPTLCPQLWPAKRMCRGGDGAESSMADVVTTAAPDNAAPESAAPEKKAKKGGALAGVMAGNTALCTVGHSGNDLHYRGYDILDIATECEFEEIAYLLVHGILPKPAQLSAYKAKLKALRGLPATVRTVLEALPASTHPMDVMRTGISALGCALPEKEDHSVAGARDIADRIMACGGSMLLYWWHFSHNGKRIDVETNDDSIGGHFLHLLHGKKPHEDWVRAMHTSLVLYAEHEFNASTFTARVIAGTGADMYSAIVGGIGALRGPKHGGANEVALEIQQRYATAGEARGGYPQAGGRQGGGDRVRARGVHGVRSAQQGDQGGGASAFERGGRHADVDDRRAYREHDVGDEEDVREPRLV